MKFGKISVLAIVSLVGGIYISAFHAMAKELAKVNEIGLTDKDLLSSMGGLNEGQKSSLLRDSVSRKQILNELIDREVLAQEAIKLKLDQDLEFKEQLSNYRKQLLVSRLLEKKLSVQLTQNAAKRYYDMHKERFSTDRAHVQHILLGDESEASRVLKLAQDPKNDFQDLAVKYSKDPDVKHNRGDLGLIGRDHLDPTFIETAFNAPIGEITGPIHTAFGFHLIKVVQKKIGKSMEFHEVELQARNALRQQLLRTYVDGLRNQAKIKVDHPALDKL